MLFGEIITVYSKNWYMYIFIYLFIYLNIYINFMDAECRITVGCEILIEKNAMWTAEHRNKMCGSWIKKIGIVAIHALPASMHSDLWSGIWCGPHKPKTLYFLISILWRFGLNTPPHTHTRTRTRPRPCAHTHTHARTHIYIYLTN